MSKVSIGREQVTRTYRLIQPHIRSETLWDRLRVVAEPRVRRRWWRFCRAGISRSRGSAPVF